MPSKRPSILQIHQLKKNPLPSRSGDELALHRMMAAKLLRIQNVYEHRTVFAL
jgi:hypothetical protein